MNHHYLPASTSQTSFVVNPLIVKRHEYFARKLLFHSEHNEQIHTREKPHAYRYCDQKFSHSEIARKKFTTNRQLLKSKIHSLDSVCSNQNHPLPPFFH